MIEHSIKRTTFIATLTDFSEKGDVLMKFIDDNPHLHHFFNIFTNKGGQVIVEKVGSETEFDAFKQDIDEIKKVIESKHGRCISYTTPRKVSRG